MLGLNQWFRCIYAPYMMIIGQPQNTFYDILSVGCIYGSNPGFKSNIFRCHFFLFKAIFKLSKQLKNIFFNFSVYLLRFVLTSFLFFCVVYCTKVPLFASALRFDSKLRKHLPTHWLYPMIWLPDAQGAKGSGKQVYISKTHSCIASLLSVYTH